MLIAIFLALLLNTGVIAAGFVTLIGRVDRISGRDDWFAQLLERNFGPREPSGPLL